MSTSINISESELAAIRQELNELRRTREEVSEQREQLDQLCQAVAGLRGNGHHNGNGASLPDAAESSALTDRRGMLRKVAGLAVGVATVGLLRPTRSGGAANGKLGNSPSATGGNMIIGQLNFATNSFDVTALATMSSTDLLDTLFLAQNFGTTAFSSPGGNIASVGYINNNGTNQTSGNFYGVYGESRAPAGGTSFGVFGIADNVGVYGEGDNMGCGVDGFVGSGGAPNAYGVRGISTNGVGGNFHGAVAAITLDLGVGAIANPNDAIPNGSAIGDLYRGSAAAGMVGAGSLWYRAGAGAPSYRRVADQTTAGAFTLLDAPLRLVDTRPGSGFFDQGNPFTNDTLRVYNIATLASLPTGARALARPTHCGWRHRRWRAARESQWSSGRRQ